MRQLQRVMITCPDKGTAVWTGFAMSRSLWADATHAGYSIPVCSACDGAHTWDKRDAFLRPSPDARAPEVVIDLELEARAAADSVVDALFGSVSRRLSQQTIEM